MKKNDQAFIDFAKVTRLIEKAEALPSGNWTVHGPDTITYVHKYEDGSVTITVEKVT